MKRRTFLTYSTTALTGAALPPSLFAVEKPRRILLRSSWQTVNIGDIAHTPGVLAMAKDPAAARAKAAKARDFVQQRQRAMAETLKSQLPS